MIRIDLSKEPLRWRDIELYDDEGEEQAARVQYAVLPVPEAIAYRRAQMELAAKGTGISEEDGASQRAFLEAVMERMSPEDIAARREMLHAKVRGWNFVDANEQPLPVTPEVLDALMDDGRFFGPLWEGLLAASESIGKKSGRSGSTGGSTTIKGR